METAGIADRIALLAHGNLIDFYQKTGFENKGQSEVTFGGGGWNDMVGLLHFKFANGLTQLLDLRLLRAPFWHAVGAILETMYRGNFSCLADRRSNGERSVRDCRLARYG